MIMENIKNILREKILNAVESIAGNIDLKAGDVVVEIPPQPELGDYAFPMFQFAKALKKSPVQIALQISEILKKSDENSYQTAGPYINVKIKRDDVVRDTLKKISEAGAEYGFSSRRKGEKVMLEFSCPNTNKPLHLGHLRNDSLGESVSRILKANGADVKKVNLINDRGIHICKSMFAYKELGNGTSPESENMKSDHFVGKYYVEFTRLSKQDEKADERAREMLIKWENGDEETIKLWEKMNKWTIDGVNETYSKTGVSFDKVYYESQTYSSGKEEVLKGLEKGVFYKDEKGTVWVDLEDINLDKKVLLRADGTSLYLTQDLGTAIKRHEDWPFETLIYVVASEQQYHFKVLFEVLARLGYKWAENLYHLSYGMVNLPEGKMKSREGTVVDADDLFAQLTEMAANEIKDKGRETFVENIGQTSEKIALSALNYYLLSTNPTKDMIFNPKESLSFNGNTGPYLQYMGARINSILNKYGRSADRENVDASLLSSDDEWDLVKMTAAFPQVVEEAGNEYNPAAVTSYTYELAKRFSKYYHDVQILNNDDKKLVEARVYLVEMVLQVLKNCFSLIGIPFLEVM